ncbi:MAG: TrmH family RNA methyltransferase [Christensenellales bacterium]
MEQITSRNNPTVKAMRALLERKGRREQSSCLIEGFTLLEEALRAQVAVRTLFVLEGREGRLAGLDVNCRVYCAPEAVMQAMGDTRNTPEVVAQIALPQQPALPQEGLVLALDRVQDPGNVGTLIRSADAMGARAVALSPGCADCWSPKVVRAAMGSLFHLPVCAEVELSGYLTAFAQAGGQVIGGLLEGGCLYETAVRPDCAVVVGNEAQGIDPALRSLVTGVRIPMAGAAESLNAAVAGSILLYEARRQLDARG